MEEHLKRPKNAEGHGSLNHPYDVWTLEIQAAGNGASGSGFTSEVDFVIDNRKSDRLGFKCLERYLEPGTTSSLESYDHPARSPSPPPSPPLRPLFDHNPWNNVPHGDEPDPDPRNNFTTFEFTSNGGGGRVSFSTRSFVTGGAGPNARGMPPPLGAFSPFAAFAGPQQPGFGNFPGRDPHAPPQGANLQDLFSMILQSMQQPAPPPGFGQHGQPDHDGIRGQAQVPYPFDLLHQIFNPGGGRHGDMVFSQDAFDRVMSQLMEQNNSSNAPPPASEDAIESLEKKKIDMEMMGNDGSAECSICMDDVPLGSEVTVLPCKHWFHGGCVTSWLIEHDTCPHCRKPIQEHGPDQQSDPSQPRTANRRPSSVSSPRAPTTEGTRHNPINIPESPSELRDARRQYYGARNDGSTEQQNSRQYSTSHESRRPGSGNNNGNSEANRSPTNGGVTGWLRDHMPFS
ncbi:hypothetical protein LTR84_006154 [Exophiala bonariae]|uniref:RING-type E3 ubiquitin transferase n=1 Tax=Exophiala bonariae TaxID=1690606 RepID=A0AAV9N2G1_9EURO|nr:hypothetical protein LTR84_006154 [Exophiala bonariae]